MQLPGPFKFRIQEPPSNVILDDRAVHEVLQSNIPRAQLPRKWSHDFSGLSAVRHRRTHRGRPAYKDINASTEVERYHSFRPSGKTVPLYLFSGEKDFTPIFYSELPEVEEPVQPPDSPEKPKQHNQYTASDQLVRNGAQSASLTKGKYRPRVNTFLRRSPSPPWVHGSKIANAFSVASVSAGHLPQLSAMSLQSPVSTSASLLHLRRSAFLRSSKRACGLSRT